MRFTCIFGDIDLRIMEDSEILKVKEEGCGASMWCRNVCTFHGTMRVEDSLCLVMDKCYGSVQSEMQRNEGRLTLEQVLRSLIF